MKYRVIVSGVPTQVKLGKLVQMFSLIMSMPNSEFLVQLMPSEDLFREVVISFQSFTKAYLAQEMLDNFVYREKTISTVFKTSMHKGNPQPTPKSKFSSPNRQPIEQDKGFQRDRSQSPHSPNAAVELDMRIELLKKHREVLEEQRKLLMEQKKLDVLKMKTFKNKNNTSSADTTPPDYKQSSMKNACGVLIKSLNKFIFKYSSLEEHSALLQHMRAIIMERIAVVVAANDLDFYTTRRVTDLYRLQYPTEEDEEFVKEALEDVRKYLSSTPAAAVSSPQEGNDNKVDGTENAADDHPDQDGQATAKDTTSPGNSDVYESIKNKATEKAEIKLEDRSELIKKTIRVLMENMRIYMITHSSPKQRDILLHYVYFNLRKRIDSLLANQPKSQKCNILYLYGSQYPRSKDEEFIKQLIKDIDEDRVPKQIIMKAREKTLRNKASQEKLTNQGAGKSGQTGSKDDQDVSVSKINEKSVSNEEQTSESAMEIVPDVNNAKNVNEVIEEPEKGKDVTANTKNKDNIKNEDETKSQSTMEIGSEVKNAEKENDNMENNSFITDVRDEADKLKDTPANTKNGCNEDIKLESVPEFASIIKNAKTGNNNVLSTLNIVSDENEIEKHNNIYNADGDGKIDSVVTDTIEKCPDNMEVNECSHGVKRKNDEEERDSKKQHRSDGEVIVIDSESTI